MMNAPLQIVLAPYPAAGSPKEARRVKPIYPPPLKTKRSEAWLRRQPIPTPRFDRERIESMKRRVREKLSGGASGAG
jgi:hypothetical protein